MKKYLLSILLIVALFFCLKTFLKKGVPYIKEKWDWYELSKNCPSLKETIHNKGSKQRIDLGKELDWKESVTIGRIERGYKEHQPWCKSDLVKGKEEQFRKEFEELEDIYYLVKDKNLSGARTINELEQKFKLINQTPYAKMVSYELGSARSILKLLIGAVNQVSIDDGKNVKINVSKFLDQCQTYGYNRCIDHEQSEKDEIIEEFRSGKIQAVVGSKEELRGLANKLKLNQENISLLPLGDKVVKEGDYKYRSDKTEQELKILARTIREEWGGCKSERAQEINLEDFDIRVINLDRSTNRYEKMKKQLDGFGLKHSRFSAIDGYKIKLIDPDTNETITGKQIKEGKELRKEVKYKLICSDDDKFDSYYIYTKKGYQGRSLSSGELGVTCSHRKLWYELANSKHHKPMLILEDDVVFDIKNVEQLIEGINFLPTNWSAIYFDKFPKKSKTKACNNIRFEKITKGRDGIWAYIVNKKSASDLLNLTEILHLTIDAQISYYIYESQEKNFFDTSINFVKPAITQDSEINNMGRK